MKLLHLDAANGPETASKRLKLNTHAAQRVRSAPAISSKTDRNLFLEELTSRHEHQLSKEKVQIGAGDVASCSTEQDFVPGSLVDESAKPRSGSQTGRGKNIEKPDVSIDRGQNTMSESSSDGEGSYDAAPDLRPNDQLFLAEKLKFLSSKNPVNDDSQIGEWTQQRSCIKCDEGGQVLNCSGSNCPIAVHISCLGSDSSFENPEDFKCPFCSYLLAASAYYEARKKVSVARKALSAFMGLGPARRKKAQPSNLMAETRCPRNLQNENDGAESELERINQAKTTAVETENDNLDVGEVHPQTDGSNVAAPHSETDIGKNPLVRKLQIQEQADAGSLCDGHETYEGSEDNEESHVESHGHAIGTLPDHHPTDDAPSKIIESGKSSPSPEARDRGPSYSLRSHRHAEELKHQQRVDNGTKGCEAVEKQVSGIGHKDSEINVRELPSSSKDRKHKKPARPQKR